MSKKKDKCIFNDSWLVDERFKEWIDKRDSKWKARCKFCNKDFDISNMGVAVLTSHVSSKKHSEISRLRKSQSGAILFSKKNQDEPGSSVKVSGTGTLDSMVIPVNSLRAEILWTLKVVTSHFSLRSCLGLNELFRVMFSDSKIASSFQLSKTKCSYFINYGLAPHFKARDNKALIKP